MSATISVSTALANALMGSSSLLDLVNPPAATPPDVGFLKFFAGPVPASADAAIDGAASLVMTLTVDDDGTTGLTFQAAVANGVLKKTVAEVWKGTNGTGSTKTMTFWRWVVGTDTGIGAAGVSDYRMQGTVGEDMTHSIWLAAGEATVANGAVRTLDDFQISLPLVP